MKQSNHLNVQPAKKFTGTVNSLFPLQNVCTYVELCRSGIHFNNICFLEACCTLLEVQ